MNSNRNDGGRFLARRRAFLKRLGLIGIGSGMGGGALAAVAGVGNSLVLPFENGERQLVAIRRSGR